MTALDECFKRMNRYGLLLNAKKCHLACKEVLFLGHVVNKDGVQPDPERMTAMRTLPMASDKDALRRVLGLFSYYRAYIKDFSRIAHPLTRAIAEPQLKRRGKLKEVE